MKLQTRFTSVETGSKIRSAIAITTPFFSLGRKSGAFLSPYIELRFKTLKKQRSSYSVHLLRREVVTLYIVQEILNITVKSRILQTETKARRGFSFLSPPPLFLLIYPLLSFLFLFLFRLITPPLFVRLVSHSIPADGDTNDMSLTTSPAPVSLSRTRESPAISRLRVVNVINNYAARARARGVTRR